MRANAEISWHYYPEIVSLADVGGRRPGSDYNKLYMRICIICVYTKRERERGGGREGGSEREREKERVTYRIILKIQVDIVIFGGTSSRSGISFLIHCRVVGTRNV